jgi:hypothetical protein
MREMQAILASESQWLTQTAKQAKVSARETRKAAKRLARQSQSH